MRSFLVCHQKIVRTGRCGGPTEADQDPLERLVAGGLQVKQGELVVGAVLRFVADGLKESGRSVQLQQRETQVLVRRKLASRLLATRWQQLSSVSGDGSQHQPATQVKLRTRGRAARNYSRTRLDFPLQWRYSKRRRTRHPCDAAEPCGALKHSSIYWFLGSSTGATMEALSRSPGPTLRLTPSAHPV